MSDNKSVRLNKLVKEFNVSIDRIYAFLEAKGIEDLKPNTKVSHDIYVDLLGEFDSEKKANLSVELLSKEKELAKSKAIPSEVEPTADPVIDTENHDAIFKRKSLKNTADKVRMILSKVQNNPQNSAKRWVWELMQNAKDVPNIFERVSLKIILEPDKLTFKHNGDPFNLDNIYSLILQNSSKDSSNTDEDITGKFGTGFISTHLLSDKIDISGIVYNKGVYRKFETCLDRSGRTSEEMLPKIDKALEHIKNIDDDNEFPIVHDYESSRGSDSFDTVFTYNLSSPEKQKAAFAGIDDLVNTLPVTLVNIPKIKSVEVINNDKGLIEHYKSELVSEEKNIKKLSVSISNSIGEKCSRNFITYTNKVIALSAEVDGFDSPKLKQLVGETPKLFRDFPLIGSNKFHFPFMLNGFKFNPTEDRDGVFIHSKEALDHEENRLIIEKAFEASQILVDWLISNNFRNRFVCALSRLPDEKWNDFSKEWYDDLQQNYRTFLLDQEIVETDDGCIVLREAFIPKYGTSKESRIGFYKIVRDFVGKGNVPKEEIILNWIDYTGPKDEIESWNHDIMFDLKIFLEQVQELENIENLNEKLPNDTNVYEWLNKLYHFLHEERETERFEEYKIIPNHNNMFKSLKELYLEDSESPIAEEFLDTLDVLGDYWRDDLIHREIKLPIQSVKKYHLGDACEQINASIESGSWDDEEGLKIVLDIIRNESEQATGDSFKVKLFRIAKKMFGIEEDLRTVINIKGFNFDKAIEMVSGIINRKIEELETLTSLSEFIVKDYDSTVIWYNQYLELLEGSESFKSQLKYSNVIPNRNGVFCAFDFVHGFGTKENPLDEKLVDLLFELDNSIDWKNELLHDGFSLSLDAFKFEELGNKIDEKIVMLLGEESNDPGSILDYKSTILELISWTKTNTEKAKNYLPKTFGAANGLWVQFSMTNEIMDLLADEKSMEFLKEITEYNVSLADVKEIMSIAGDLDDLGLNGISAILDHAKDLLELEKDFHFLRETGENIEEVFKEALEVEGINIGVNHLSKGSHDFELYCMDDSTKRVFVEIKSYKHGTRNSFKFASSQVRKSLNDPDKYFVCMLERPLNNESASVSFLKDNLYYKTNLNELVSNVVSDIEAFEKIDNKSGDVKLVLELRERPRIHVKYDLMKNETHSFNILISDLKSKLT